MLTQAQTSFFEENGYLVVEDLFDEDGMLFPVRAEYAGLLDALVEAWVGEGALDPRVRRIPTD